MPPGQPVTLLLVLRLLHKAKPLFEAFPQVVVPQQESSTGGPHLVEPSLWQEPVLSITLNSFRIVCKSFSQDCTSVFTSSWWHNPDMQKPSRPALGISGHAIGTQSVAAAATSAGGPRHFMCPEKSHFGFSILQYFAYVIFVVHLILEMIFRCFMGTTQPPPFLAGGLELFCFHLLGTIIPVS